jgi:hypothetical protein
MQKTVIAQVLSTVHRPNNVGERLKLEAFLAQNRMGFEERDHFL